MRFIFLFCVTCLWAEESKVVVLGGGVGALSSSLYLARAGLEPVVVVGPQPGGLLTQSHAIQNWPGEMQITGHDLVEKMRAQAELNGAKLVEEEVTKVDFSKRPYQITTRTLEDHVEKQYSAQHVIIAMGTAPNHLGIPGELGPDGYWGKGVTNCAICDGNLYEDARVGVVGGGDAAVLEALYLANIAKEVHVFVRKKEFRAVEKKRLQTLLETKNVKVHFETTVSAVIGDGEKVTALALQTKNKKWKIPVDGLFLAIGSTPNSKLLQGAVELDKQGYVVLKNGQETSRSGVYAIGDIVEHSFSQAISAAGDGAKAALQAQQAISDGAAPKEKSAVAEKKAEGPKVLEIGSLEAFEKALKESDVPVLVDFYAAWCGPCRQISPRIDKSADQLAGQVKFLKVNVDRVRGLSHKFNIRAMPTAILFHPDGRVLEQKIGADEILKMLKRLEEEQAR